MNDVKLVGWKPGFLKVSFTALIREYAGLSLSQAHQSTIDLTEGRVVVIRCQDIVAAKEFAARATKIGAIVEDVDEYS